MSEHIGALGWGIAGATAVAFDLLTEQTMSQWYRDRVHDPRTRAVALGVLALSVYHLARPEGYPFNRIDPITRIGGVLRSVI